MQELTGEDKAEARRQFEMQGDGGSRVCSFCGGIHMRACPRVAEFEMYENGSIKRVVFWPEGKWSDAYIIWPEQAYEEDEAAAGE